MSAFGKRPLPFVVCNYVSSVLPCKVCARHMPGPQQAVCCTRRVYVRANVCSESELSSANSDLHVPSRSLSAST